MKKTITIIVFITCLAFVAKAQVSVTATAGVTNNTYTNLTAAFDAINNGTHQGVITILITDSVTQTTTATLNSSGGQSSYSQITIRPTVHALITGNINGALIQMTGAKNVIFDGHINDTSTERSLILENSNATAGTGTSTIYITGGGSVTLQHLIIRGSAQGQDIGTILLDYSGTGIIDDKKLRLQAIIYLVTA